MNTRLQAFPAIQFASQVNSKALMRHRADELYDELPENILTHLTGYGLGVVDELTNTSNQKLQGIRLYLPSEDSKTKLLAYFLKNNIVSVSSETGRLSYKNILLALIVTGELSPE